MCQPFSSVLLKRNYQRLQSSHLYDNRMQLILSIKVKGNRKQRRGEEKAFRYAWLCVRGFADTARPSIALQTLISELLLSAKKTLVCSTQLLLSIVIIYLGIYLGNS